MVGKHMISSTRVIQSFSHLVIQSFSHSVVQSVHAFINANTHVETFATLLDSL